MTPEIVTIIALQFQGRKSLLAATNPPLLFEKARSWLCHTYLSVYNNLQNQSNTGGQSMPFFHEQYIDPTFPRRIISSLTYL